MRNVLSSATPRWRHMCFFTVCAASSLLIAGCGGGKPGPKMVPVRGTVKYQGKPLAVGSIQFYPTDSKTGRSAAAVLDSNGRYAATTLQTGDGLIPGDYTIAVTAIKARAADIPPAELAKMGGSNSLIPERYNDPAKSDLKLSITDKDSSKVFDLDLKE